MILTLEEHRQRMKMLKEKKWPYPIPKTVRSRRVERDDKVYDKCPYQDCDYMVEDTGYIYRPSIDDHVREVHEFVWINKGGRGGWWPLSKFHSRLDKKEENH